MSYDGTGSFSSNVSIGGNLSLTSSSAAKYIYMTDKPASGTGTARSVLHLDTSNNLGLGYGTAHAGYDTYIDGANIYFRYMIGTTHTIGMLMNSSGNVTIGSSNLASTSYKLYVNGASYLNGATTITGTVNAASFSASNSSTNCQGLTVTSPTGYWSYIRLINKDTSTNYWDIGILDSTGTAIAQANAFEIRNGRDSNSGISIRNNTSSYGKLVVRVPSGQCTIGYWSTADNPVSGSPIWTSGYTADTDKTFGWYYRGSSGSGWKMLLSPAGDLSVDGTETITKANGTTLILQGNSANTNSGEIIFRGRKTSTTGFKIAGEYPSGTPLYDRQNLTIYASDATDAVTWVQAFQITRSANVIIGTSAVNKTLTVNGATTITGTLDLGTSSAAALNFKRGSANYINAPASGYFVFMANGATGGVANASLIIEESNVYARKSVSLGTSTYRWSNVYSSGLNVAYGSSGWASSIESTNAKIFITHSGGTAMAVGSKYATTATDDVVYIRSGQTTLGSGGTNILRLAANGTLTTYGDQVVSSDATLKKDWRPLNYGISDIAKATAGVFTWKDGKGISAGTKAQDWEKLVPQLVHGEEGHKSLAYGQIAMLNTILLARQSESHEEEIKKLRERVTELENEVERLRAN